MGTMAAEVLIQLGTTVVLVDVQEEMCLERGNQLNRMRPHRVINLDGLRKPADFVFLKSTLMDTSHSIQIRYES